MNKINKLTEAVKFADIFEKYIRDFSTHTLIPCQYIFETDEYTQMVHDVINFDLDNNMWFIYKPMCCRELRISKIKYFKYKDFVYGFFKGLHNNFITI